MFLKQGYQSIINHNLEITEHLVSAIAQRPYLQLASQPQMNVVCFRLAPKRLATDQWDSLNTDLQKHLLNHTESPIFLSLTAYRGSRWLKAVLLNPFTTTDTIDSLFAVIDTYIQAH